MTRKTVQCSVRIQNDISEQFQTNKVSRQGDALARLLFDVGLEKVMRDAGILVVPYAINPHKYWHMPTSLILLAATCVTQ
jgi:hypothetical protein